MKIQRPLLACPPVGVDGQRKMGIAAYTPPKGGKITTCDSCGMEVWIGPRQMRFKENYPETETMCTICALPIIKANGAWGHLGGNDSSYVMKSGRVFGPNRSEIN